MKRWVSDLPVPSVQKWQSRAEILKSYLNSLTADELLHVRPDYYPLRFKWRSLQGDDERKFRPDQLRVPAGNPEGGEWTREGTVWTVADKNDAQDPAVERTTQVLHNTLARVNASVASRRDVLSAPLYGIRVHTEFAAAVKQQNLPGIGEAGVEQNFDAKGLARYGMDGSIRTDIVLRNEKQEIIGIYDVKTGNATMRPAREAEIRAFTGVGPDVPVIILHAVRGTGPR